MTNNIFSASCLFVISITPLILRWRTIQHNNKQENKQEIKEEIKEELLLTGEASPTPVAIPVPIPVPSVEIEIENLVAYAMRHQLFLDQSRKSFFERHHILIKDLVKGKLRKRNRFRELLLGVKAVGKTEMCKVLRSYMAEMYKQVLTIYISYDASDELLSKTICRHIVSQKNISESLATILSHEYASDRIEALELLLEKNNIRLFLLVDEFHFVYKKPKIIGEAIVQEMAVISGTNRGYIHCIVTGSSSCLRSLAFAKLDSEKESDYPSYSRQIDLNSTKLQPKWIFPIVQASDFRKLLEIRYLDEDVAARYFCSGGRPGLAIEVPNIDDIPYSLSAKHLPADNSLQATVLNGIFDCMESFNVGCRDDFDDEISVLESDLTPISETVLWRRIQEKYDTIDARSFEHILYRLADDGMIIFYQSGHIRMLSISCSYVYFQLRQNRTSSLTWKEAAALKIPTGYFHVIAEDVAFRFIKQQSEALFNIKLQRFDSTILNFGVTKKTNNDSSSFSVESKLKDISLCIHKELVDGKDSCGADGILLQPVSGSNNKLRVLRFQLKLGGSSMKADEVIALKNDMFKRGETIVNLLSSKYDITEHICYLITTRHVIGMPTEDEGSEYESNGSIKNVFKVIGRKELASAKVWTKEVMCLGHPYSSNKKLNYDQTL